jgi:hypothetical protein
MSSTILRSGPRFAAGLATQEWLLGLKNVAESGDTRVKISLVGLVVLMLTGDIGCHPSPLVPVVVDSERWCP